MKAFAERLQEGLLRSYEGDVFLYLDENNKNAKIISELISPSLVLRPISIYSQLEPIIMHGRRAPFGQADDKKMDKEELIIS